METGFVWKDFQRFLCGNYSKKNPINVGIHVPIGMGSTADKQVLPMLRDCAAHLSVNYTYSADMTRSLLCMILGLNNLYSPRKVSVYVHPLMSGLNTAAIYTQGVVDEIYHKAGIQRICKRIQDDVNSRVAIAAGHHCCNYYQWRKKAMDSVSDNDIDHVPANVYAERLFAKYGDIAEHVHILYGVTRGDVGLLMQHKGLLRESQKIGVYFIIIGQGMDEYETYSDYVREMNYIITMDSPSTATMYTRLGEHTTYHLPEIGYEDFYK